MVVDDFDPVFVPERLRVTFHAAVAGFDVGASPFEGRDDLAALDMVLGVGIVQQLRKRRDVGGVESDQANTQISRHGGVGCPRDSMPGNRE